MCGLFCSGTNPAMAVELPRMLPSFIVLPGGKSQRQQCGNPSQNKLAPLARAFRFDSGPHFSQGI